MAEHMAEALKDIIKHLETNRRESEEKLEKNRQESETKMVEMMATISERMAQYCEENRRSVPDVTQYQYGPDVSVSTKHFDGTTSSEEVATWLEDLKQKSRLFSWPDGFALEVAKNHLRGAAGHWYAAHRDKIQSWNQFTVEFEPPFGGKLSVSERWEKMKSRIQQPGEEVVSYFHEKYYLCSALNLSFNEVKTELLCGMEERELVCTLMTKNHEDSVAMLNDIKIYEKIKSASQRVKASAVKQSPSAKSRVVNRAGVNLRNLPNAVDGGAEQKPAVRCFRCGAPGHLLKDCPRDDVVCFKCDKTGHIARNCDSSDVKSENSASESQRRGTMMMVTQRASRGATDPFDKFVKFIEVNEREVKAFIDPGSAVCTIAKDIVDDYGWEILPCTQPLYGFGRKQPVFTVGKVNVNIKVDDVRADEVEVLVVSSDVQPHRMIVGRTFTELDHIAYARVGNTLAFGYADEEPFKDLEMSTKTKVKLYVTEHAKLRPGEMCYIDVEHAHGQGLGQGQMQLVNDATRSVTFRKGQKLAVLSVSTEGEDELQLSEDLTRDMVNVDESATEEEITQLMDLLRGHRKCFALNIDELGCTHLMQADIQDTGVPVSRKPYKKEKKEREKLKKAANEDQEEPNEEQQDGKKKKKKGAKEEKEVKDAKKGPSKKAIAAMQEALKKMKEDEERLKREEEERIKREEEAEDARLEALRLEQERREKKKQEELRTEIQRKQQKVKERFDKRRYRGVRFNVGDVVVMKRNPEATGESTKLQVKYKGPLVITQTLPSDTYGVTNLNPERGGTMLHTTAHVSQLKRYLNADEDIGVMVEEDEYTSEEEEADGRDELHGGGEEVFVDRGAGDKSDVDQREIAEDRDDGASSGPTREQRSRRRPIWMDDFECDSGGDTE